MSLANALAAAGLLVMIVLLWNDPIAAGHDLRSLATIIAVFSLGLLTYYVMRWYRKRQGLDVTLAVRQIPIE